MVQAYSVGAGISNVQPAAILGSGVPPASFKAPLGQQWYDKTVSPAPEYVYNGTTWDLTQTSGDIAGTANQITVSTASGTTTLSIPSAFTAPGSIAATTSVTATLGNVTATNGNIVRGTSGNKDVYSSVASTTAAGANSAGTVTLVAGEAVIATTAVTAASQIRLYRQGVGATGATALGILSILTRVANTSFTIRAVNPADATAEQAADISIVAWEIVN